MRPLGLCTTFIQTPRSTKEARTSSPTSRQSSRASARRLATSSRSARCPSRPRCAARSSSRSPATSRSWPAREVSRADGALAVRGDSRTEGQDERRGGKGRVSRGRGSMPGNDCRHARKTCRKGQVMPRCRGPSLLLCPSPITLPIASLGLTTASYASSATTRPPSKRRRRPTRRSRSRRESRSRRRGRFESSFGAPSASSEPVGEAPPTPPRLEAPPTPPRRGEPDLDSFFSEIQTAETAERAGDAA
ncbi:hypothetical protein M885DRAFT_58198 [Pelagophyceae sp. CCMP2097]|nr:hypothetical protein M885DRAFT_58198 [Pelagophyceae sp. CCMP2097]